MGIWGIYARVSTEEQADAGLSLDAQLSALRAWASQKGIPTREFVDAGATAWTENLDKRPQFKALLEAARTGELEGIAVTHLDRFSRKLIVTLSVLGDLGQRGVGFISLENAAFDFSRPADRLLLAVLGAFAEYYSAELSRKIRRGLRERAGKGLHVGTLPFGYCNGRCAGCGPSCDRWGTVPAGAPPILHPDDWPGVRLAFETYSTGAHTDATIAQLLNERGYRSRTPAGRAFWNKHSIAWLLTNRFYAGAVTVKGRATPGQHQAIIDVGLFDQVQVARLSHQRGARTYTPKYRVYLFAGLMVCSGCGRRMRAQGYGSENATRGYRCTAIESGKVECAKSQSLIRAEPLEEQFGELVKRLQLPANWRDRVRALVAQSGKRQDDEAERKRLTSRLERIKWLYVDGAITQAEYQAQRADLKGKLSGLAVPVERELLDAGAFLENLAAIWDEATLAERREMVLSLIARVDCDPDAKRLTALLPRPAFVPLFRQVRGLREQAGIFVVK